MKQQTIFQVIEADGKVNMIKVQLSFLLIIHRHTWQQKEVRSLEFKFTCWTFVDNEIMIALFSKEAWE